MDRDLVLYIITGAAFVGAGINYYFARLLGNSDLNHKSYVLGRVYTSLAIGVAFLLYVFFRK